VPRILALANQKGGVGKTTTAVNTSAYLAQLGYRVLLIDIDPQGNATSSIGFDKSAAEYTTYDILIEGESLDTCVVSQIRPNLDLLPSNEGLAGAEVELVSRDRREFQLRNALEASSVEYDVVVIDCPPSLGLLTVNALTTARGVIIPIQCEYLALEGLMQLINTIDLVKQRLNPRLDVLGVLMTMFDARTRLAGQVVSDVRKFFPSRIFETVIPRAVRLAEAPSYGQPIFEYDRSSAASQAYQRVAEEICQRLDLPVPAGHLATEATA
jgi:chromosome partitioning protein